VGADCLPAHTIIDDPPQPLLQSLPQPSIWSSI
jgi:hypothetical protein